ncbi:MAG: Gfo/Idh/MocA family protein [Candidatus Tectimicrobiota bacterium]
MERLLLVGYGSIGRRHLHNLRTLGVTDLLVVEPDPVRRQQVVSTERVPCYGTLHAALAQHPSIVVVTTPSQHHVEVALAAARQQCHLFIEKPLSHSLAGLDSLAKTAADYGLITLVGCNMRFHPGPRQVQRWLSAGLVGDVLAARLHTGSYLPTWRPQQDYHHSYSASPIWGGAVLDCIHELDLALWLLGPARLAAACLRPAQSLGLETDGLAELLLEHTSGALSSVHLNFVQRNYQRRIEIIGSTGTLLWDITAASVEHYAADGRLAQRYQQPADWHLNTMYLDEMAYFLHCVRTRSTTQNPLAGATQTLTLALQARGSL